MSAVHRAQERADAAMGSLDVTHGVTMARVMAELWALAPTHANLPLVVLAAAFVGKLHRADRAELDLPIAAGPAASVTSGVLTSTPESIVSAVRSGDVTVASAHAAALGRPARLEAYRALAPYAAFEAAVRPIRIAHAIKTTEALFRLERDDEAESPVYLQALVHFLGSRVRERSIVGTAAIAAQFLKDGRPPVGLY